jgi:hypothetical protein
MPMSTSKWYVWFMVLVVSLFLGFGHPAWWIATLVAVSQLAYANEPQKRYRNKSGSLANNPKHNRGDTQGLLAR